MCSNVKQKIEHVWKTLTTLIASLNYMPQSMACWKKKNHFSNACLFSLL